jgi:catechol 2,3-dioxygenase-like lactoylglutathione lyase family enzyme
MSVDRGFGTEGALNGATMQIVYVIPQLRTTDLAAAIQFYTVKLGFSLEFQYEDFYACVRTGDQRIHFKLSDVPDPSIPFVDREEHFHLYLETADIAAVADELKQKGVTLVRDVHETAWGTRELVIHDPDGHTLYFGQPL